MRVEKRKLDTYASSITNNFAANTFATVVAAANGRGWQHTESMPTKFLYPDRDRRNLQPCVGPYRGEDLALNVFL